jgi:hypothetical protein
MYGMGAGIGDMIGGFLGMGQNNNPADAGMPYLGQIGSTITPYYQPYINAGNSMIPGLQSQYGQLVNNPGAVMNKIGAGFHQSPGYQFQVNQALGAANRAAAAGGMLGSPQEQQNIAGTVNGIANQDYYNYLNHGIGLYDQGLGGMSHMFDTGFAASSGLANNLAQALSAQAQMAYAGQNQQNQSRSGFEGDIAGGIGSIIGSFL